jgi:hypothetical protein
MSAIKNIVFSAKKTATPGDNWLLTVTYDAHFTAAELELKFQFEDWFRVFEDEDHVTGKLHKSVFTPTAKVVHRKLQAVVAGSVLAADPPPSHQDLYAHVSLQNASVGGVAPITKKSADLVLDP